METTDYTDYTDVFSRVYAAENGEYMGYGKNELRCAAVTAAHRICVICVICGKKTTLMGNRALCQKEMNQS
ncbi:MAG: hypothetical protein IKR81_03280, partial [Victivallales bacterium]|nr:hypothetical protein [Victivallales bacterium]